MKTFERDVCLCSRVASCEMEKDGFPLKNCGNDKMVVCRLVEHGELRHQLIE